MCPTGIEQAKPRFQPVALDRFATGAGDLLRLNYFRILLFE